MHAKAINKGYLIFLLLISVAVTITAGGDSMKEEKSQTASFFKKILVDFKSLISEDLFPAGLATDLYLEAECATLGADFTSVVDNSASNGEYVTVNTGLNSTGSAPTGAGAYVRFQFDVTSAGNYSVYGRVIGANSNDDSFWVRANGGTWYRWNELTFTSWTWAQVYDSDNANANVAFALNNGTNTLDFAYREDGAQLDKIFVTLNGSVPSGAGNAATNCEGEGEDCVNQLGNEEFDSGQTDWWLWANSGEGANATFSIDNTSQVSGTNSARVDVSSISGTEWHIQLGQSGNTIENGKTYQIKFSAKADFNKNLALIVQLQQDPYTNYYYQSFPVTTTATDFSYEFTANTTVNGLVSVVFNFGNATGSSYIDNVYFGEACTEETNFYLNATGGVLESQPDCNNQLTRTFVVNETGIVDDVNFAINLSHASRGDVQLQLTSPQGTTVTLIGQNGDTNDNYDLYLDDESAGVINDGDTDDVGAPYGVDDRSASPNNPLSAFDGEIMKGAWTMSLCNVDNTGSGGQPLNYHGAGLYITANNDCYFESTNYAVLCDDNGTTTGGDDVFYVTFNPTGANKGLTYSISGDINDSGISYNGNSPTYGPFNISSGNLNITITDDTYGDCTISAVVMPPNTCSSESNCFNNIDDDGDGLIDEDDPDCADCITAPSNGNIFYADFEDTNGDNAWTLGNGATDGDFVIGVPSPYETVGTSMEIAAHGGIQDLLTGDVNGQDLDGGPTTAQSRNICLATSLSCANLRFYYYFADHTNGDNNDYLNIELRSSIDNSVLQTLVAETGNTAVNHAEWVEVIADLSAYIGSEVYIYVEAADLGGGSKTEVAIDDVAIFSCFEICGNGLDDDNDGFIDDADSDCGDCVACFTPVVSEFLVPFPEDQVLTALQTIFPSTSTCGFNVPVPTAPIYTYISISAFVDNTIIFYDHWEDGFEVEPSNPTQSTTEIWGDGNLSNGHPPGNFSDVIDEGTIIILNNAINPSTRQSIIDYDGGDAFSSSLPLSVTRAAWASETETLLAGALEVFPTSSWGTDYTIPVGTNVDPTYQYFDYSGAIIMASENNTTVNIDENADGTFETTVTINKGESHHINGTLLAGAEISADKKIQVDLITGDICDHYESRWFTLPPESQWEDNYYSPMPGTDQVYQIYNPNSSSITVKVRTTSGAISDLVVPAKSTARLAGTDGTGYHLYTTDGSVFYPIVLYNANTGTGDTGDLVNSTSDWGAALIPYSRLTKQVVVGWAAGQDPTYVASENGSPVWVTAFYPPGSADAGSGQITICVDFNGDNMGVLSDGYGRQYDASYTIDELDDIQIYDPDGNQTNMVLYICDDKDALLSVMWGQENGVATPGAPGLDVGTGVPGLNPFFAYKSVALIGDRDNDGEFSLGDTIQYSIGITNPGLVPVTGLYSVSDDFPTELQYIENTTFLNDGVNLTAIPDAGGSSYPLDEGGTQVILTLNPSEEAVISFDARIIAIPPADSLITNIAHVSRNGIQYDPKVTIPVNPVSEICENLIDDDLDGFVDCDCETEDNLVRGIVYIDKNENGINDDNQGFAGVPLNIYTDNNGNGVVNGGDALISSTTTEVGGGYEFRVSGNVLERQVATGNSDAEQDNGLLLPGGVTTNNSDLDLGVGYDGNFDATYVGTRFRNISIPSGAVITNAYLEFTANSNEAGNCSMTIYAEAADNAAVYQNTNNNLGSRSVYNSVVNWTGVPNWFNNSTYQTPNLSSLVQLVIDRPGWNSGNAISFLITGTDRREAFSFEDDPDKAPRLVIEYAFFPSNYIVELDTAALKVLHPGADFQYAITEAISFTNSDDFVCDANFAVVLNEVCDNGIDDDNDGLIDCDDPDVWDECCLFDEWNYLCDDNICSEIDGVGIKGDVNKTLTFADPANISHIVIEATFDGGSGHPDEVTFTNGAGLAHTVEKINFDTGNDKYYRAFFNATDEITLSVPAGTNESRGETFIAYVFRNCENMASAGAFTHKFLHKNSHTFTFDIPTSTTQRDIEIVVPLSEITNDGRIAQIRATAGTVTETITIDDYNFGNSLNITPFTLSGVAGEVSQITVEVISPDVNGQSLYLSGAGSANVVCPQLALTKEADDTVFRVGETVTYTYTLTNAGDVNISQLDLNDDKLGNISLPQTTLASGESVSVTQTYTIQASDLPGGITNIATLTGRAGGEDLSATDTEYIDIIDISLVKTPNQVNSSIGSTVTYTYDITNNGSIPLNLELTDDKLGDIEVADATSNDLILLYDFSEGAGDVVKDISGYGTPIDVTFENSTNHSWGTGEVIANAEARAVNTDINTKIYNELIATNEITVAAWVTPANTTQNGPARIVSSSNDSSNRNFTLGQEAGNFNVRLRTTTNGNNGNSVTDLNGGTVTTSLTHVAFTRNAAGTAVLYVDGVAVDTETITGDFSNWGSNFPFVLFNEVNATRTWLGGISNVAVYKTALSASEIQDNYNLGATVSTGRVVPGETVSISVDHVITAADAPSPLVNVATVTGTPANHPKTVTDEDTAEVNFNNPPEICGDGIDNDFDGLTDCDDPDCTTPSLTFNGNTTVCAGESTTIEAVGNENDYTYEWSHGLGSGSTKTITPPSDPSQNVTTTYSVTVTDNIGCTAVGTIDLTAESLPAATVTSSNEFCNQGNGYIVFTFDDHPDQTQLNFSIDGGSTYPYTSQDNNGTFAVSNLDAGTYDLWIRWGDGECPVDLPDVTLINAGGPSVDISGPSSICEGEQAQISALATGGTAPYLYTWDNGLGNGATKTIYPATTTTYSVTATDNQGCTNTDQVQITVLGEQDPACSDCPNPADDDNDGICASEDCDDNDPNIPAPPGTACDDGNPNSINDEIQADECTCEGEFLPCDINFEVEISQPIYNNNNTDSNLADDTFTFSILINGDGGTWTADGQSGAYGTTATFGPYPVDSNGISFDILDTDNPNCRENISVNISSCIYSGVCTCCE